MTEDNDRGYPWVSTDGAVDRAEGWQLDGVWNGDQEVGIVLAAEVKRLRDENESKDVTILKMLDLFEVERKKEVALSTKLARVEALPAKWREMQPPFGGNEAYAKRCVFEQLTEELEKELKDPQST